MRKRCKGYQLETCTCSPVKKIFNSPTWNSLTIVDLDSSSFTRGIPTSIPRRTSSLLTRIPEQDEDQESRIKYEESRIANQRLRSSQSQNLK